MNIRKFKRGEYLFKEGDRLEHIYIIKTGRVSVHLLRSNKKVNIDTLSNSQVLGEHLLVGQAKPNYSAEATADTEIMMIPLDLFKTQFEAAAPGIKLIFKSVIEALVKNRTTVRSIRMEEDPSPCPQRFIPRLFSIVTLVASHVGKKQEDGSVSFPWNTLKIYTTRMFIESPVRMNSFLELLKKLDYAELTYETNEDGDQELSEVRLKNSRIIEEFGEFYQYNMFKGGKAEILYVDKQALQIAEALLCCAHDIEIDRRGAVAIPIDKVIKLSKSEFGLDFKAAHLNVLERKGLFASRKQREGEGGGVFVSFDKAEFERVVQFWNIIVQIDKWNERGFIDLDEKLEKDQAARPTACPECHTVFQSEQKFCMECGYKLAA